MQCRAVRTGGAGVGSRGTCPLRQVVPCIAGGAALGPIGCACSAILGDPVLTAAPVPEAGLPQQGVTCVTCGACRLPRARTRPPEASHTVGTLALVLNALSGHCCT